MGCESRIYLSKSNLADKTYLHKVRVHLMELGYDILEWNSEAGEQYTEHPMLECDQMVMVGYDLNDEDIMEVGKGQFTQLEFREGNGFDANFYFVGFNGGVDDTPSFYSCESIGVKDEDSWKEGYGELQLVDEVVVHPAPMKARMTKKERPVPIQESESPVIGIHLACITLLEQ